MQGVKISPLFGTFKFDLFGRTAYAYSLAVLFLVFLGRAPADPFAVRPGAARHPRNWVRMPAIGADSRAHIRKIYTISAAIAGIAGALIAQTTPTVSLEALSFERSADVLVMLVLGGAGRLMAG